MRWFGLLFAPLLFGCISTEASDQSNDWAATVKRQGQLLEECAARNYAIGRKRAASPDAAAEAALAACNTEERAMGAVIMANQRSTPEMAQQVVSTRLAAIKSALVKSGY